MPGPSRTQQGPRASAGWAQSPWGGRAAWADTQHLCRQPNQMAERMVAALSPLKMATGTALCLTPLTCSMSSSQTAEVEPLIEAQIVPSGR